MLFIERIVHNEMRKMDITFKEYRKNDIHGTILYPATMIAPMQHCVLRKYLTETCVSVLDPFCGSGTALHVAQVIQPAIHLVGNDINPLAYLITRVKLEGVSSRVKSDIDKVIAELENDNLEVPRHDFVRIDKWFRPDIIDALSRIRRSIINVKNNRNRRYLWYIFSNLVRKYSNSRSSTFKLHVKQKDRIMQMRNDVVEEFCQRIQSEVDFFIRKPAHLRLYKKDIMELMPSMDDNSIDLTVTSPPYGDNATTVTYGEFSWLALNWIAPHDLEMEGWEISNAHIIDSKSLGGSRRGKCIVLSREQLNLLNEYTEDITKEKKKKVEYFFADYFFVLSHIARITRKYIILTLGNRTVDGVNISLTEISRRFLESNGYTIEAVYEREIVNKRIPKSTSCVNGKAVSSMNDEYVLIAKKEIACIVKG